MSTHSGSPIEQDQEAESTRLMLDAIETRDHVTQRGLASELGIALGLTNIYLKRCINKGLIKVRKAPARRYAYYLTAKGFSEKARLTAKFLARSLSFFRLAREDCAELFGACEARGLTRAVLAGAGDLCEIATLAALDSGIEVVAIFDEETNRQQFAGVPVVRSLETLPEDAVVVVTDIKDPQAVYNRLAAALDPERVLFPNLLRLSRHRAPRVAVGQSGAAG
ncbi:winged helix-turn-helix transcriptional regulator [Pelagibius sp. CAU 1746]|uniref:winged helix-turn-helix transcriptional regulator n=1 Tax=Pelagibius sp. CAU 1746 TaxID=3140370 RepID=UPI00325BD081